MWVPGTCSITASVGATTVIVVLSWVLPARGPDTTLSTSVTCPAVSPALYRPFPSLPAVLASVPPPLAMNQRRPPSSAAVVGGYASNDRSINSPPPNRTGNGLRPSKLSCGVRTAVTITLSILPVIASLICRSCHCAHCQPVTPQCGGRADATPPDRFIKPNNDACWCDRARRTCDRMRPKSRSSTGISNSPFGCSQLYLRAWRAACHTYRPPARPRRGGRFALE